MDENGPRRKLTTILSADCAGFSRMMRADEEGTYRLLTASRRLIDRLIVEHQGRLFGSAGDSVIAEFTSPVEAVRAAVAIQSALESSAPPSAEGEKMQFRIGINIGDVIVQGDDLIGDGVNVAARLQGLAEPGGLCISSSVHEQVKNKLPLDWSDIGAQVVKNIAEPVRAYRLGVGRPLAKPSPAATGVRRGTRIRLAGAGALLALIVAGAVGYFAWQNPEAPSCKQASIAVVPFANLSGDPAQDYFSDGTTEDVTAALARFSELSVIAHAAVLPYKGKQVTPEQISRELGVCYALTGSVRKEGDQVLVTSQLVDAPSGKLLWSDSYDGTLVNLFELRNRITLSVVGKLAIKILELERRRALKKPTESLQAYDLLLRGRDAYARNTRAGNAEARKLFEQAIKLDPSYASAYAALGFARITDANSGWTEFWAAAIQEAETLAQKAIELDEDNAEAHLLLSWIFFNRGKYDLALAEDNRAVDLNPSDASAYADRGSTLVYMGRSGDAIEDFEVALRLYPGLSSGRTVAVGWAYYLQRRFEEAATIFSGGIRTAPDDFWVYTGLAASYAQLGRDEQAKRAAADVRRTWPFFKVDEVAAEFLDPADRALIAEGLRKAGLK